MSSSRLCVPPCARPAPTDEATYADSPQWRNGKFRNAAPRHAMGTLKTLAVMWRFLFGKPADTVPARPIPVQALSRAELLAAPDMSLWRLGHSTMLMKLGQQFWLTDPVFSERASPFTFMGPKRFHAPPLRIEDLPEITGVLLSHDHYDHLDRAAIEQLAPKVALPMHYKTDKCDYPIATADEFLQGKKGVNRLNASEVEFKGGKLPATAQIIVLKPTL